jgi:hypothetical protein
LLGTWTVDLDRTAQNLRSSFRNQSQVAPELQALRTARWRFSRAFYSIERRSDPSKPQPTIIKRLYTWMPIGERGVLISEILEGGDELTFEIALLSLDSFEHFDVSKGYAAVWLRAQ